MLAGMSQQENSAPSVSAPLTVFLSAVSTEFHKTDPQQPLSFRSYRDALREELSALGDIRVIVQEELHQGFGDLLSTLDRELSQCRLVIHLVGDMAGFPPVAAELRRLGVTRPEFLGAEPELKGAVGDGTGITYTQWELYLAFHHGLHHLVFCATPQTARSPLTAVTDEDRALQQRHLERITITGEHRTPFLD